MAKTKKLNGKKRLAKKSARRVALKAKARRKTMLVAKPKRIKPLPAQKPVVVVAVEAQPRRSQAFAWAGMPFALMNLWLAPFERRT